MLLIVIPYLSDICKSQSINSLLAWCLSRLPKVKETSNQTSNLEQQKCNSLICKFIRFIYTSSPETFILYHHNNIYDGHLLPLKQVFETLALYIPKKDVLKEEEFFFQQRLHRLNDTLLYPPERGVVNLIEALDAFAFNADLDGLYKKVFSPETMEEEAIKLVCEWASSTQRESDVFRVYTAASVLQKHVENVKGKSYQSFFLSFLESVSEENHDQVATLFGQMIRNNLFSHSQYVNYLITKGFRSSRTVFPLRAKHRRYLEDFPIFGLKSNERNQRRFQLEIKKEEPLQELKSSISQYIIETDHQHHTGHQGSNNASFFAVLKQLNLYNRMMISQWVSQFIKSRIEAHSGDYTRIEFTEFLRGLYIIEFVSDHPTLCNLLLWILERQTSLEVFILHTISQHIRAFVCLGLLPHLVKKVMLKLSVVDPADPTKNRDSSSAEIERWLANLTRDYEITKHFIAQNNENFTFTMIDILSITMEESEDVRQIFNLVITTIPQEPTHQQRSLLLQQVKHVLGNKSISMEHLFLSMMKEEIIPMLANQYGSTEVDVFISFLALLIVNGALSLNKLIGIFGAPSLSSLGKAESHIYLSIWSTFLSSNPKSSLSLTSEEYNVLSTLRGHLHILDIFPILSCLIAESLTELEQERKSVLHSIASDDQIRKTLFLHLSFFRDAAHRHLSNPKGAIELYNMIFSNNNRKCALSRVMTARDHIEREGGLAIQEIIQESTPWTCFQNRLELALLVDEWNHVLEDRHITELTPESHLVRAILDQLVTRPQMAPIYSKFITFLGLKAQEETIRRVLLLLEAKPIHQGNLSTESESSLYSVLSLIVMPALLASQETTKQQVISSLISQFSDFIESCHSFDINAHTSLLPIQQALHFRLQLFAPLIPYIKRHIAQQPPSQRVYKYDDIISMLFNLLYLKVVQITDEMDVFAFILDLIFVLLSPEANTFPILERPDKIKEKTEHLQRILTGPNRTRYERIIPFLFPSPMPSAGPATGLTVSIASKKRQLDPAELIEGYTDGPLSPSFFSAEVLDRTPSRYVPLCFRDDDTEDGLSDSMDVSQAAPQQQPMQPSKRPFSSLDNSGAQPLTKMQKV